MKLNMDNIKCKLPNTMFNFVLDIFDRHSDNVGAVCKMSLFEHTHNYILLVSAITIVINVMKLYKLMTRRHIAVERIDSSSENLENHSDLYSVLRCPILLRYPWLNLRLDDFILMQTAYVIYQNAKLAYDVKQNNYDSLLSYMSWTTITILCQLISSGITYTNSRNEHGRTEFLLNLSKIWMSLVHWSQLMCHTFRRHSSCMYHKQMIF